MIKTNALRLLEDAGITYETLSYEVDEEDLSGIHAAMLCGISDAGQMFKTLVAKGEKNGILVYCIPVEAELDLKKCALAAQDKRVELIPLKELTALTGYMRGGCSPVGMKKKYPTFIDESAVLYDDIYVSAGRRGLQMKVNTERLAGFLDAGFADIIK